MNLMQKQDAFTCTISVTAARSTGKPKPSNKPQFDCREGLKEQLFDVQPPRTFKPQRPLWFYFLCGILFELVLIGICFLPESSLVIETRNLVMLTHYPLMVLVLRLDDALSAIIGLLLSLMVISIVWGLLTYFMLNLAKRALARADLSKRAKLPLQYSAVLIGLIALAWAIVSSLPEKPIAFNPLPETKSVVEGNAAFALNLYQKLKEPPGNLFFSPYSISAALAMTHAGARGQTESEMAKVLHFDLPPEQLHSAFGALTERMKRIQRWNKISLITANSLWCQQDHRFTDDFQKLIRANYAAEARTVDFKHSPQAAAGDINKWVEQMTKGKIHAVADPAQFDTLTKLVLCNAIYFKGKWQHQFKVKDTKPAPFHVTTNQTVTVPMMWQKAHFKMAYSEDNTVELLEMPYSGNDLSMVILLPNTRRYLPDEEQPNLSDLEQQLTTNNLAAWLAKLDQTSPHETSVYLPRFTTTQSFDLADKLESLGLASAFNDRADFSGMDGTKMLYLSDVLHKAFVEVNEAGTEATAVTLTLVRTKGAADRFIVDHPFLFLIREHGSGSILFLGRIVDPTK